MLSSTTPHKLAVSAAFDGSPIAELTCHGLKEAEEALGTAVALFRNRQKWLSVPDRIEVLRRAGEIMRDRIEDLTLQAAREGGKPYVDSKIELRRAIDGVENCIEVLRSEGGHVVPMGVNKPSAGRVAFTRREPIGVVVAVSAFNHPMNLIVHQVAPGIAAGCPVIVKPAPDTPLSGKAFVEILHEAGLPPEWCQLIVTDEIDVAEKLVTDDRVGIFSFIGSARVGWMLRSKLAPGTRAALEHGGAAPVIVAADADLQDAVPRLVKGGFYHAGQVCVSVQRIFAHADIARSLAEQLARQAAELVVGDPTNPDTEVGPLIRPGEVSRVAEWVTESIDGGAECLTGGEPLSETCYPPTVLYDPPPSAKVSTNEIFGPVVCVFPYTDLEEAIDRANALPYAFQSAVFTRDIEIATQAYSGLDASAVMINDHTAFRVDWMPFAGLRQSGLGVGGIPHTYDEMTIEKMMVLRSDHL